MRWFWLFLISSGLAFCCCSKSSTDDRHAHKVEITSRIALTAGGGSATSPNYRGRISIGVPQPYGEAKGSGKLLKMGAQPSP
jgi:hypothetical protein